MLAGNFDIALLGFQNVIKVKPGHAIAYYCSAICHKAMSNEKLYRNYKDQFEKYVQLEVWSKWTAFFDLPALMPYAQQSIKIGDTLVSNIKMRIV
jgi:hypothetical protein